ncbi:MAG: riboflavin biosynthesis protein RibF [Bacteroidetes bacterium RBG_13_43_22]|nr:MAG: riboflavin biosynthesis protein RibF [Bacteroidetes bacterium RBG_13_43_22]
MIVHQGYSNLRLINPVVTLGIFDGVHLGHRFLLDCLIDRAREIRGDSVVITFQPHPRLVLESNTRGISFLSTMEEKKHLLKKMGIDHLVIIRFTRSFSRIRACDFVEKILVGEIGTKYLILGHDHHFGHQAEGDYRTIENCAVSSGFMVEQVKGFKTTEGIISSSMIREALLKGKIDDANRWLGYDFSLKGIVVEGKKIGRKIGYPTANIMPCDKFKIIPGDGVYAVEVKAGKKKMPGMLSIGNNPTVNKTAVKRSIEVNIFNFSKDIYGKKIEILFRHRIRNERKFDSTEQLARQMENDRDRAIELLG